MWSPFRRTSSSRARWIAGERIAGALIAATLLLVAACSDATVVGPPAAPSEPAAFSAPRAEDTTTARVLADAPLDHVVGGALTNGANHTGQITLAGQADSWTLTATQGDAISLSVGEVSGSASFTPWVRLVAPDGTVLGSGWGAAVGQVNVAAPTTGTYTVLIASADAARSGTGSYRLTLAKGPGAFVVSAGDQGGPLTNGAVHTGAIVGGDLDMWSFTATQGESIMLSVGEITGSAGFTPWIRLVAPNGAVIGNNWGASVGQVSVAAPSTGTYTVIIGTADAARAETGSYRLTLAEGPGAFVVSTGDQGGPMTNGAIHTGAIDVGDLDVWSFSATQGESISLSVGEVTGSASFTPWIRLVAPNGAVVGNNWGAAVGQVNVAAPSTGTYTVVIGTADAARAGTGSYRLTLVKAPATLTVSSGDEGGTLSNGGKHDGTIVVGDLDAWTFSATQGNTIALSVGEITGSAGFTPWIRLVAPNGAVIGNNWGAGAAQVSVTAPSTGTYTVIIGTADAARAETGTYRLTLARAPGTFVVSAGDQGGALLAGADHGTITIGDLDVWTFAATQGGAIALNITELTGNASFTPWIRLVAPNGTVVGNNWGAAAAQIRVTATATGTYTAIVGSADAGRVGTGDYVLTR